MIHHTIYQRRAFTLLEVILALALSVIVLAAIGWAIQLHLKALDTRRSDVEESQLARAVLKMIADDLHSVIAYNTVDFSEAAQLASLNVPELDVGEGEEGGMEFSEDPHAEEEEGDQDISADLTPGAIPGIFGNQYQLQIDLSRLPRIEDFDPAIQAASGKIRDLPSDVKTVAYYLQPDTAVAPEEQQSLLAGATVLNDETTPVATYASPGQGWGRGLVRRSLDRAATQWALENNDLSRLDATGEVIAPEVVALEFRYFDGQQWLPNWDSQEFGGLPMAIEVAIAIEADDGEPRPSDTSSSIGASSSQSPHNPSAATRNVRFYHQVIRIPSAESTFDEEALETDVE